MARGNYKQKIMSMAGIFVVKQPMDDGFMLAIYDNSGKTLYRRIMRLPSEVAYDILWKDAYYSMTDSLHGSLNGSYPEYADPERWPEYVYGRNGVRSDGSIIDWERIYKYNKLRRYEVH